MDLTRGDYLSLNMDITADGQVTVYEFDECAYGWSLSDIAVYQYCHFIGGDPLKKQYTEPGSKSRSSWSSSASGS